MTFPHAIHPITPSFDIYTPQLLLTDVCVPGSNAAW